MWTPLAAALGLFVIATPAAASDHTVTRTFSSGNVSELISPSHFARVPIRVRAHGQLKDVDLKLRIDQPDLSDLLSIEVDNPVHHNFGRTTDLASGGFLSGANLGAGPGACGDQMTTFDDEAATPISAGAAPYLGSYAPDQPLATSFDGYRMTGKWNLSFSETPGGDAGTLYCWKVRLTYRPR